MNIFIVDDHKQLYFEFFPRKVLESAPHFTFFELYGNQGEVELMIDIRIAIKDKVVE